DRRKLLFATQGMLGLLALGLGLLTVTGRVQLWQVYVFALLLGCTAAFDAPARQSFVSELVGEADLSNAVALNSTSFNAARMIGPATAGLLIAAVGCGWVFIVNAASFAAVLGSLCLLRTGELHPNHRAAQGTSHYADGFRYVWQRPDLRSIVLMLALVGTFGLNFPIFISSMAVKVFHAGAGRYGLLTSAMAIGSVTGALLSARRAKPYFALLVGAAGVFGAGLCVAALVPDYGLFGVALAVIGVAAQTFTTSTNSYMQLTSEPQMRGRVVAVFLAVVMGGTPIGAPLVGWAADTLGPRWAMGAAGALCTLAAAVGLRHLARHGKWRIRVDARRLRVTIVTDPVSEA
ncbi:MAG TPA: MFS transporter, partial [Rhodanobacter sp.]|nr:MFS transporter [Rhodanobacter sp.]